MLVLYMNFKKKERQILLKNNLTYIVKYSKKCYDK